MQKAILSFVVVLALGTDWGRAQEADAGGAAGLERQMLVEQKAFLECLAFVYSPELWISYDNRLYFLPRTDWQREQIEAMKEARDRYVAFTNRETRHQFVAKVLGESNLDAGWQKKLLLPYTATNTSLTPVLGRPVQSVERYSVLKFLPRGDALIQAGDSIYSVLGFGRGVSDAYHTNALLVPEGRMTYRTDTNGLEWVEAFTDAALSSAETAVLDQAVAAFQRKAAGLDRKMASLQRRPNAVPLTLAESQRNVPPLAQAPGKSKARQEFENLQARATETSPFMEYLLAKAYLDGNGTAKDEKLGLLWMNKAAQDGSGDAQTYLGALKGK
jgi:TPR repeat protein